MATYLPIAELIDLVEATIPSEWTWLLRKIDGEESRSGVYFANVMPPGPGTVEMMNYGQGDSPEEALTKALETWKGRSHSHVL